MIFDTILMKILPKWTKIGDISKFEILNPKIQNLTKSQNLKSLTLTQKSPIWTQNF